MKTLPNCLRQCSKHFSVLSPSETGERETHNLKNPAAKEGRTIHGLPTMYRALCEVAARTSESPGRLRRYAPYKGLHPLRRFAAIPEPSLERYTRDPAAPFQRG